MSAYLFTISDTCWGGKHQFMWQLIRDLNDRGETVVVAAQRGGELVARCRSASVEVVECDFEPNPDAGLDSAFSAAYLDAARHCFVVVTGRRDLEFVYEHGAAERLNVSLVVMRHSAFPLSSSIPVAEVLKAADVVIGTSNEQVQSQFLRLFQQRQMRAPSLLRSGVDGDHVKLIDDTVKVKAKGDLGVPGDRPVVGILSRLSWEKGIEQAITEIAGLLKSGFRLHLVVAGSGPLADDARSQVRNLGISDHVTFTGFVHDVWPVIDALDWGLLPSIVPETGPLALKEMMARGVPVIAAGIGGIPEFIDSEVGFLFKDHAELAATIRLAFELGSEAYREKRAAAVARILRDHLSSQVTRRFVELVDLGAVNGSRLQSWLGEASFTRVKMRREISGGFLYVPRTSALIELDESTYPIVEDAWTALSPSLLKDTATITLSQLAEDLYLAGAITGNAATREGLVGVV